MQRTKPITRRSVQGKPQPGILSQQGVLPLRAGQNWLLLKEGRNIELRLRKQMRDAKVANSIRRTREKGRHLRKLQGHSGRKLCGPDYFVSKTLVLLSLRITLRMPSDMWQNKRSAVITAITTITTITARTTVLRLDIGGGTGGDEGVAAVGPQQKRI